MGPYCRELFSTTVFKQNLNRAFDWFVLTPEDEISLQGSFKKTLRKCCIDLLRPPGLSEWLLPGLLKRAGDCGNVALQELVL